MVLRPGGGGVLPYITYTGMCRDFEGPDLERGIHFRGVSRTGQKKLWIKALFSA